ncbi:hypothetical protein BJ322DRAFT_1008508, partial [Thelephora terrestris]
SYNWVDSPNPTIIVPGDPRIWRDMEMPMTVPLDSGTNFIDQNGHRMNNLTLLPLIRAVQDLTGQGVTEKFDWPSADFVADRGRLRKLLAWSVGLSDQWRIDTQLAGANTVLLSGRAPVTKETSGRSRSYAFNYREASTYPVPGLENEYSHHRIIAYNFDGLRMVVRFEVDASLPYDTTPPSHSSYLPTSSKGVEKRRTSDPLDVRIIRAGSSEVPQTHLLEIKAHNTSMKWSKMYPQPYLSQTPYVYHASHDQGTFTHVRKFTLGQNELTEVEKDAQEGFKKLRKLLGYIKSLVLKHGAARISLVCEGRILSVYRIPQGENCLPDDALALFVA